MAGLAQWLTQRHDKATASQSRQLDALYRLLASAAALKQPAEQEALLRSAIEAHFSGTAPDGEGPGGDEPAEAGQVRLGGWLPCSGSAKGAKHVLLIMPHACVAVHAGPA